MMMEEQHGTQYFLFTKTTRETTTSTTTTEQQIICPHASPSSVTFLLPKVNLTYYHQHGLFESALMDWAKQFCNRDGLFLDIGAHTGTYTLSYADACAHVLAFEPQKMTYYALCGGVALSNKTNVTCVPFALGSPDQIGTTLLNIRSTDGGGSSICPLPASDVVLGQEYITVTTLDQYFVEVESIHKQPISFIKMDVEYNELNVLRGAVNTLRKHHYPTILFEANTDSHQQNTELFQFLETEMMYRVVSISGCDNMFLAVVK
jgi:FkbM family methyltransferase